MHASPFDKPIAARSRLNGLYGQVGVETSTNTASPHRLVGMLFEGYMESLARARGAMRDGLVEVKGRAIARAVSIVEEGLRASLNREAGGKLSQDLDDLYNYVAMRLTLANVRNDPAMLDECQRLMVPVQEAWESIGPQSNSSGSTSSASPATAAANSSVNAQAARA
jgi:flagellar secretion chaperone FliS